jgi:hypothetical protein
LEQILPRIISPFSKKTKSASLYHSFVGQSINHSVFPTTERYEVTLVAGRGDAPKRRPLADPRITRPSD